MARRIVLTLLVAVGLFLFIYALTLGRSGGQDVAVTSSAVENRIPTPGAQVLRQASIEIDLATGWTGILQVNGVEIPEDQLNCIDDCDLPRCSTDPSAGPRRGCRPAIDPQNRVYFVPGDAKVLTTLPTGPACVNAVIWRLTESRAEGRDVSWCFQVTA